MSHRRVSGVWSLPDCGRCIGGSLAVWLWYLVWRLQAPCLVDIPWRLHQQPGPLEKEASFPGEASGQLQLFWLFWHESLRLDAGGTVNQYLEVTFLLL